MSEPKKANWTPEQVFPEPPFEGGDAEGWRFHLAEQWFCAGRRRKVIFEMAYKGQWTADLMLHYELECNLAHTYEVKVVALNAAEAAYPDHVDHLMQMFSLLPGDVDLGIDVMADVLDAMDPGDRLRVEEVAIESAERLRSSLSSLDEEAQA